MHSVVARRTLWLRRERKEISTVRYQSNRRIPYQNAQYFIPYAAWRIERCHDTGSVLILTLSPGL